MVAFRECSSSINDEHVHFAQDLGLENSQSLAWIMQAILREESPPTFYVPWWKDSEESERDFRGPDSGRTSFFQNHLTA